MSFHVGDTRSKKLVATHDDGSDLGDVRIDQITHSLLSISTWHNQIHQGRAFSVTVITESLNDSETLNLAFKTGPTFHPHMRFAFSAKVAALLEVWEGASWTQGSGSGANIRKRNRNSSIISEILENRVQATFTARSQMIKNVTGINTASASRVHRVRAWGTFLSHAAPETEVNEYVLKPNTTYLCILTAKGGSNGGQIILTWYEPPA